MRWHEKMSEGMRLMKEACAENGNWDKCEYCPFDLIYIKLMTVSGRDGKFTDYIPMNWRKEKENEC